MTLRNLSRRKWLWFCKSVLSIILHFPVPSLPSERWHQRTAAAWCKTHCGLWNIEETFWHLVCSLFVLSLCSLQTLNKNNLLPPDESCNFFPTALPQTNVYATTYYPSPLGKYDFPSMDSPCSYMHSWCTKTHSHTYHAFLGACDHGYIPLSVHADALENAWIHRKVERITCISKDEGKRKGLLFG